MSGMPTQIRKKWTKPDKGAKKMEIYDNVTVKTDNGDKTGVVVQMVETTTKFANADMKAVSTETTTNYRVLVFPGATVISASSDKVTKNVTKADKK